MLTTILLPLDGSPLAERAVPYAETLARAAGAKVILLRVPAPTSYWDPEPRPGSRPGSVPKLRWARSRSASASAAWRSSRPCATTWRLPP